MSNDRDGPNTTAGRLTYLVETLHVKHEQLLRLAGMSRQEVAEQRALSLQEIIDRLGDKIIAIEHILRNYFESFDYDVEMATIFADQMTRQLKSGECRIEDVIPDLVGSDGKDESELRIIRVIMERKTGFFPAVAYFLIAYNDEAALEHQQQ